MVYVSVDSISYLNPGLMLVGSGEKVASESALLAACSSVKMRCPSYLLSVRGRWAFRLLQTPTN